MAVAAMELKIHTDSQAEEVKRYAEKYAAPYGSVAARALALAKHVRERVAQYPDASSECTPALWGTLILGRGDADDIAVAIGTLCKSIGIETRIVREKVASKNPHAWTVYVEVELENGEWYRP